MTSWLGVALPSIHGDTHTTDERTTPNHNNLDPSTDESTKMFSVRLL